MSRALIAALAFLSASCLTAAQEQSNNESIAFPLRPALATQQLQGVSEDSETCSLSEAQSRLERAVEQFLQEEVVDGISCDSDTLGILEHCPAVNCSQIFSASQIFHFPGYYWITADNGSTIQVYCDFQFSNTTAEIHSTEGNICPTMEQRESVQGSIQKNIQPQLSLMSPSLLTCTSQITGLVAHCPANSCSQVFDLISEGFLRLSNYYWLQAPDGDVAEVYCNSSTMQPEYTSCQQVFVFEIVPSGTYTFHLPNGDVAEVYCNRSTMQPEYSSCQQLFMFESVPSGTYTIRTPDGIHLDVFCNNETGQSGYDSCAHANSFGLPSGTYTIRPSGGSPVTVYCDMDNEECGGGVWTRVASYNYSDLNTTCPGDWNLITSPIRACERYNPSGGSCASAFFSTYGVEFSSVCGRVIAIQVGSTESFINWHSGIDGIYVDGVSITYGNPRKHVWTFAAYVNDFFTSVIHLCPCSQPSLNVPSPPSYVGNNYFCDTGAQVSESRFFSEDPLWDGQGCGGPSTCCSFNNPPWFSTALSETTSEDIEVRICEGDPSPVENTPITILDLYIQ